MAACFRGVVAHSRGNCARAPLTRQRSSVWHFQWSAAMGCACATRCCGIQRSSAPVPSSTSSSPRRRRARRGAASRGGRKAMPSRASQATAPDVARRTPRRFFADPTGLRLVIPRQLPARARRRPGGVLPAACRGGAVRRSDSHGECSKERIGRPVPRRRAESTACPVHSFGTVRPQRAWGRSHASGSLRPRVPPGSVVLRRRSFHTWLLYTNSSTCPTSFISFRLLLFSTRSSPRSSPRFPGWSGGRVAAPLFPRHWTRALEGRCACLVQDPSRLVDTACGERSRKRDWACQRVVLICAACANPPRRATLRRSRWLGRSGILRIEK